jgi:hypothetical protein
MYRLLLIQIYSYFSLIVYYNPSQFMCIFNRIYHIFCHRSLSLHPTNFLLPTAVLIILNLLSKIASQNICSFTLKHVGPISFFVKYRTNILNNVSRNLPQSPNSIFSAMLFLPLPSPTHSSVYSSFSRLFIKLLHSTTGLLSLSRPSLHIVPLSTYISSSYSRSSLS